MAFDMVKFERGQIWEIYYRDKNSHIAHGHEQQKERPWIILSVGKFNHSSGMVTCAPITTRDAVVSPAQVLFTNANRVKNVIMCEQIRTFDYKSGAYIFEYMGTVSDEVLEMVDNALSIHLGMHYSPATLNRLYESIEVMIRSLNLCKTTIDEPKFTDEDILEFAAKLESLVPQEQKEKKKVEPVPEVKVPKNNRCDKLAPFSQPPVSCHSTSAPEEETILPESSTKKSREYRRWTKEDCKEFLSDMDTLPMKEVMSKWGIEKKTRLYSKKHYIQSLLSKED